LPGGLWLVVTLRGKWASLFLIDDTGSVQIGHGRARGARDAQAWAEATAAIVFRALGNHLKEHLT
jgi:hypothetical protein